MSIRTEKRIIAQEHTVEMIQCDRCKVFGPELPALGSSVWLQETDARLYVCPSCTLSLRELLGRK